MKTILLTASALCAATMAATPAAAAVTFTLSGVSFSDGGKITGSFTTDDALKTVSSFDIFAQGGAPFSDMSFSSAVANTTATLTANQLLFTKPDTVFTIFSINLSLNLTSALTGTGTAINGGSEYQFIANRAVANGGTIVLGSSTPAVPEPAGWAMMIVGLGAIGQVLRRRGVTTRVRFAA